jgi:aspartokinase
MTVLRSILEGDIYGVLVDRDRSRLVRGCVSLVAVALTRAEAEEVERALNAPDIKVTVQKGRDVVMVYAVNMRDEEGLIAGIVLQAIKSGAAISHISDMHDRVLMVVSKEDSMRLKEQLEGNLAGARA